MIIFVEGLQLTGKSTMIENSGYNSYKFNFSYYTKEFNIKKRKDLRFFQVGKDMSMLYFLDKLDANEKIILIDRGPISSLYYSILLKRFKEKDIENYIKELKKYNYNYIFFIPKNNENLSRNKKDYFDKLNKNINYKILNKICTLCNSNNIKLKIFINDLEKTIKENVKNFKEVIKECY